MHVDKIYYEFNKIMSMRKPYQIHSSNEKEKKESERFEAILNFVLSQFKEEYKTIFTRTYLTNDYQFWWLEYYCKSSYYRKRCKAVTSFVRLFKMIYENFTDVPAITSANV